MRIRKPIPNSPSSSSSSSSLYTFSSLTNNSLASSIDSSSSTSTSSSFTSRCQGLNLLVKAIHQVTDGSVVGVPYIQKRVITRRRRRVLCFESFFISECLQKQDDDGVKCKNGSLPKRQQRKRLKTVPTKYQDSAVVVQSSKTKPKSRRLQRSVKICEELES